MVKHVLVTLAFATALASSAAFGQAAADGPFQVRAISSLKPKDAVVVTNTNASAQAFCASAYAMDAADGHLLDCCTCSLAPNAIVSIPIASDLLENPKPRPKAIVLEMLGSTGTCNAGVIGPLATGLLASLDGTPLSNATLSAAQLSFMLTECTNLHATARFCDVCPPSN